ncbi:MAG: ABC transporter substrate-binding protein [Rubellimicrobium sp.]|nr:ABC transporter substrate-binding protein [Rubellimicrobium sp.]
MLEIGRRSLLLGGSAAMALTTLSGRMARAGTPVRGGHLRVGLGDGSTQDTVDPTAVLTDAQYIIQASCRSTLVNVEPDGSLTPNLAVRWEPSDDLKQWSFEIRQGVTFHSGKPLTVEDVIASINVHRGPDSVSPVKAYVDPITDIVADGPDRITISLSAANVDFPGIFAQSRLPIVPARDGSADRATHDGTGPYVLESFEPGVRMTFTRYEDHWDKENVGFFDSAEVIIIADDAARMNALRTGQVDLINQPDLRTLELLKRDSNLVIDDNPSGRYYIFGMMSDVDPFTDRNIRLALKYAINRDEMVRKVLHGYGRIGNDQPVDPSNRFFNPNLEQREFDPDKARYYLNQAGLDSITVPLSVAEMAFAGAVTAGSLFAASAAQAGITLDVTREPDDGYFENVWLKKPFTADYWTRQPTLDAHFTQAFSQESPWNETHFRNDRFTELLVSARATLDEAARGAMYQEMQQLIHDESGAIIPMFANYVWVSTSRLRHGPVVVSNDLDGLRCIARWWFED